MSNEKLADKVIQDLWDAGYLYLGIASNPKSKKGAKRIIQNACDLSWKDGYMRGTAIAAAKRQGYL